MWLYRYLLLPPTRQDLTQGLFYSWGFREKGGQAQVEACVLLDYAGHRLTLSNMNQMRLLELNSLNIMWVRYVWLLIAWTKPSGLVLCSAFNECSPTQRCPFNLEFIINLESHLVRLLNGPAKSYCSEHECPNANSSYVTWFDESFPRLWVSCIAKCVCHMWMISG